LIPLSTGLVTTEDMMVERRDVEFEVEGGDRLRGWLFQSEVEAGPHRCLAGADDQRL
jgi:hypothetical protein